jgi:hypothetical protein
MKNHSPTKHILHLSSFLIHRSPFIFHPSSFILLLISSFIVLTSSFSFAGLPQEMCIYYGQAMNQYGWPYLDGADVILKSGTNEIVRHTINGSISPGINFSLYVSLDDGSSVTSYDDKALHEGDPIEIIVRDSRGEQSIMQTNIPPVGAPGEVIMINVTAATDTDHDGLSDEWEQELVDMSTNLNSIADVKPNDDFDGDGASNIHEFNSGNFAFLDYDYMFIEKITRKNDRFKFELLSVPGKAYYVSSTTNIMNAVWSDASFATTETGEAKPQLLEGDGDWLSFYIDYPDTRKYFRLNVK